MPEAQCVTDLSKVVDEEDMQNRVTENGRRVAFDEAKERDISTDPKDEGPESSALWRCSESLFARFQGLDDAVGACVYAGHELRRKDSSITSGNLVRGSRILPVAPDIADRAGQYAKKFMIAYVPGYRGILSGTSHECTTMIDSTIDYIGSYKAGMKRKMDYTKTRPCNVYVKKTLNSTVRELPNTKSRH